MHWVEDSKSGAVGCPDCDVSSVGSSYWMGLHHTGDMLTNFGFRDLWHGAVFWSARMLFLMLRLRSWGGWLTAKKGSSRKSYFKLWSSKLFCWFFSPFPCRVCCDEQKYMTIGVFILYSVKCIHCPCPKHKFLLGIGATLFRKLRLMWWMLPVSSGHIKGDRTITFSVYFQCLLNLWSLDCCSVGSENV